MKKSMIACCSAMLALAVFADEPAAPAETPAAKAPQFERAPRGPRGPRMAPVSITVTDKTTDEEIAAYKKQVADKIDASYAEYKAKAAEAGKEKAPMHISLMVLERRSGMGPGMRGPRGDRGPRVRRGGEGEKPAETK